jgi:hypothetical protein
LLSEEEDLVKEKARKVGSASTHALMGVPTPKLVMPFTCQRPVPE